MRLQISETKNAASFYVVKSTYENGKHSSKVVEKLGTRAELESKLPGQDPVEWATAYVAELTRKEKEAQSDVMVKLSPRKTIAKDEKRTFNGGYLFLESIYHQLGLHHICRDITDKYKFTFNLDSILSRLLYARIIFPASKLGTFNLATRFLEPPDFELQHIYRALDVVAKEMDFLQAALYKNSLKLAQRNTGILYYDCTNYFFETEQADGLKQYGASAVASDRSLCSRGSLAWDLPTAHCVRRAKSPKEHRPNPIVQMGLFMDGNGIPLAFNLTSGNANEQTTLKPLEEKILADFGCSRFVVCTDAGLSSLDNRRFNDLGERAFVTTQSLKKLKKHLKEWALDPAGWRLPGSKKVFNLRDIEEPNCKDQTFYKERWIKENGLEQKLIVTFSLKYRDYKRKIRESHVARAQKIIDNRPDSLAKARQNDFKRLIKKTHITGNGEVAEKTLYRVDSKIIAAEEAFDGYYAVCTNLEDDASSIMQVNHRRWEIEECFRIMKSEFRARPVYLSDDDRIRAHFTTCFMALVLYRLLEKKLEDKFTCNEIVDTLREMDFLKIKGEGYTPEYTRSELTDALHEAFGFRTDYEIVKNGSMKKIFKATKSK